MAESQDSNDSDSDSKNYTGSGPEDALAFLTKEIEEDAERLRLEDRYPSYSKGFFEWTDNGKPKPQYNEFTGYMVHEIGCKSIDRYTWIYKDGFYKLYSDRKLHKLIRKTTLEQTGPGQLDSFSKLLLADSQIDDDVIEMVKGKINLGNGILDVKSRELLPHSKDYFFKYKIPHLYDPKAKAPKFLEYLDHTFQGDQELVDATFKIFGYCLAGGEPFLHKSFVLFGEGRNGKSVWLHVLRHLIGLANVSTVSMSLLGRPFSVVQMDGKLANITGELPTGRIDSELFKTAVGGEYLTAAKKGKDEYGQKIDTRLVFATNKFPVFKDTTIGMWEKLFIIPFERYLKPEERNPKIFTELEAELSGILNYALDGLDAVLEHMRIDEPQAVKDCLKRYRIDSDAVFAWLEDHVEVTGNKDEFVLVKDLYERFLRDEEDSGKFSLSKKSFSQRFEQCLKETGKDVGRVRKVAGRGFYGVSLKQESISFNMMNYDGR